MVRAGPHGLSPLPSASLALTRRGRARRLRIYEKIELSFSKYWYWGIGAQLCKYWNIYWVLIALRLTKSGIEYVILAGSSFFPLSGAKSQFLPVMAVVLARAARAIFQGFGFRAPEISKFSLSPQGPEGLSEPT